MKLLFALFVAMASSASFAACKTDIVNDRIFGPVRYQVQFLNTSPAQIKLDILDAKDQAAVSFIGYPIKQGTCADTKYWLAEKVYEIGASGVHLPLNEGYIELQTIPGFRGYNVLFKSKGRELTTGYCKR
ncbi:MAG: hypothetical protein ACK5V3_12125 [Bdellovibrionales bacterium]